MNRLFSLWNRIQSWFTKRYRLKPEMAVPEPISRPEQVIEPVIEPAKYPVPPNREAVSIYEKRRRRHDKFVTPKGELPTRSPKPRPVTQEIKPRLEKPDTSPTETAINFLETTGNGLNIVDRHHEDTEEVLYKGEEILGEFNFRDTILEQLDRYFFYLKRMKKHDKDAYGFYRHVGATILPYLATGSWNRTTDDKEDGKITIPPLPAWFNEQRPSFGCFAYGADPETEKYEQTYKDDKKLEMWVPKFMYFLKYKLPPLQVQPISGGDIYVLTVWWDRPSKTCKHGIPQQLPIFISKDGQTVRALKVLKTDLNHSGGYVRQFAGFKNGQRNHPPILPKRAWQFPKEYQEWAEKHNSDVQTFLCAKFIDSVSQVEHSRLSMTRIAVTKHGMTAVFSINIRRTAYFFQDRDIQVTHGGTRKPIFHMVRPHIRKDGTAVKMHFRGARDFTWAGYDVRISIPGIHHVDINEIDIGAADEDRLDKSQRKGAITTAELGKRLADHVRSEWTH